MDMIEDTREDGPSQSLNPHCLNPFPDRFPLELELQILEEFFRPDQQFPPYCIPDGFFDPWSARLYLVTLDTRITSVCRFFQDEGRKIFFKRKIFLFGQLLGCQVSKPADRESWSEYRDPTATRLLNFIDRPDWKNKGSESFINRFGQDSSYTDVDTYRHLIQNLVLKSDFKYMPFQSDWDWPLKVDWTTLPELRVLYLDLLPYSRRAYCYDVEGEEIYNEKVVAGARRMGCLNLEKLVLVGLCSLVYWNNIVHKRMIEQLFKPALGVGGKIEYLDQQSNEMWRTYVWT